MQFAKEGSLKDYLGELQSEPAIKRVVKEILEILRHLHYQNILHRDIKPENILILSKEPL